MLAMSAWTYELRVDVGRHCPTAPVQGLSAGEPGFVQCLCAPKAANKVRDSACHDSMGVPLLYVVEDPLTVDIPAVVEHATYGEYFGGVSRWRTAPKPRPPSRLSLSAVPDIAPFEPTWRNA
jgi:hypothetical protein